MNLVQEPLETACTLNWILYPVYCIIMYWIRYNVQGCTEV